MNDPATPSASGHRRLYFAILLVAIIIVSVQVVAYFNFERFFLPSNNANLGSGSHDGNGSNANTHVIEVNTLFNYGNHTSRWFNDTHVPVGWNFYNLTVFLANGNVESTYYPSFQEHYIDAINGIRNDNSFYWHLWLFCNKDQAWAFSSVGADNIGLSNDKTVAWYYASYNDGSPPVSGAQTVIACSS